MERLGELAEGLPGGQNDADSEPGPALAPPCSPRVAPTARQRNFSTTTHDAALNFQLLDLGRQYFVWVSAVGPKLGSLTLAIKSPAVRDSTATLPSKNSDTLVQKGVEGQALPGVGQIPVLNPHGRTRGRDYHTVIGFT